MLLRSLMIMAPIALCFDTNVLDLVGDTGVEPVRGNKLRDANDELYSFTPLESVSVEFEMQMQGSGADSQYFDVFRIGENNAKRVPSVGIKNSWELHVVVTDGTISNGHRGTICKDVNGAPYRTDLGTGDTTTWHSVKITMIGDGSASLTVDGILSCRQDIGWGWERLSNQPIWLSGDWYDAAEAKVRNLRVSTLDAIYVAEKKTYADARTHCQEYKDGWDLAEPRNSEQNDALLSLMTDHPRAAWIGLNDLNTESEWRYVSGDLMLDTSFRAWNSGAPTDPDEVEDCAGLYLNDDGAAVWNDMPCTGQDNENKLAFLCAPKFIQSVSDSAAADSYYVPVVAAIISFSCIVAFVFAPNGKGVVVDTNNRQYGAINV